MSRSLNDQVAPFAPMPKAQIATCSESIVREVQALARPPHHFKIKAAVGLGPEDDFPDIWLPVWTWQGMALVERLNAVDVPISRLFTAVATKHKAAARSRGADTAEGGE